MSDPRYMGKVLKFERKRLVRGGGSVHPQFDRSERAGFEPD